MERWTAAAPDQSIAFVVSPRRAIAALRARSQGLIERVLPPITWSGVFASWEDVPLRGGHEQRYWVEGTREQTAELRSRPQGTGRSTPLAILAGVVLQRTPRVRVLDVAGGMGVAYVQTRRSLGPDADIAHLVVELPAVAAAGAALFSDDPSVAFVSELPGPAEFDIVHTCLGLQYARDPFDTLVRLLAYRAPYALLLNLTAGRNPTYVTAQLNLPGSVVACWMLNLDELEAVIREKGYRVIARTWSELSLIDAYHTRGIPRSYRPERFVDLICARSDEPDGAAVPA